MLLLALAVVPAASAAPHLPPQGKVWQGVVDGDDVGDFVQRTGKRPAIWQQWLLWGGSFEYAFRRASGAGARLMVHISTAPGQNRPGRLSPGDIARGGGDDYLLRLNRRIAEHGQPVYVRLMGEMNNCDNAYASHNCDGSARGADHAAARFRQAWKRSVLVLRGGSVDAINRRLGALGMPPVATGEGELPRPQVAVMWAPMTGGSPFISALDPQRFWPGRGYVDWVGTSFYSRFPTFKYLEPYYKRFAVRHRKPFAFAEWAMWGSDDATFPRRLFSWIRSHRRTRMVLYNQGANPVGPFRLSRYPRSTEVLRRALSDGRYAAPSTTGR